MSPYSAGTPLDVPPNEIINSPTNPRKRRGLDVDSLNAMAASIKAQGVMAPIIVRSLPGARVPDTAHLEPKPVYEIIAGERRWRGAMIAGIPVMPVLVREDLDDEQVAEMQLVENIEREDLDPLEEAAAFEMLRSKFGYTVEKIAEKITEGKGPSYVYKHLALNKLVAEVREAMYAATPLDVSLALLIATYEADQQPDVLDYLRRMADANKGEYPSFRQARPALEAVFNLSLDTAPFDTHSTDLLPAAGSCMACPKRTANQREIFEDAYTGPDSCTDMVCFQRKREAHLVVLQKSLAKEGFKVITGEEALKAKTGAKGVIVGFQRLDAIAYTETGNDQQDRDVTFADALRSMGKKAPKHRVFIDPHTLEPIPVITTELAEKLVPKEKEEPAAKPGTKTPDKARVPSGSASSRTSPEEDALGIQDVQRAVLLRIFEAIRARQRTAEELCTAVKALIVDQDGCDLALEYMGYQFPASPDGVSIDEGKAHMEAWIDAMLPEQLGQLLAMAALEISFGEFIGFQAATAKRIETIKSYGVDILAVRDKVAADLEDGDAQQEDPLA